MERRLLAVGSLLVLAACAGEQVASPDMNQPGGPLFSISAGNPNFAWRPPIANQSATGTFNASFFPKVRICSPGGADCPSTAPEYPAPLSTDHYQYDWKTPKTPTSTYRVEVWNLGIKLGFADVNTSKTAIPQYVSVNAGATLPVKFVITTDCTVADCIDPNIGGTVTTELDNGKIAGVQLPPQDGGGPPITLDIQECNPDLSSNGLVVHGSCITINSSTENLTNPALVFICDALDVPLTPAEKEKSHMHRRHTEGGVTTITVLDDDTDPCATIVGEASIGGFLRALVHGKWKKAGSELAGLVSPKPLYALHLGAGGKTGGFSDFQFAETGGFDFGSDGYSYLNGVTIEDHFTSIPSLAEPDLRSTFANDGTVAAPVGWASSSFSPSLPWPTGQAAFGGFTGETSACPGLTSQVNTAWPLFTNILLRKNFSTTAGSVEITVYADNDVQIWLDGVNISKLAPNTDQGRVRLGASGDDDDWFAHGGCADQGPAVITVTVANGLHTLALRGDDYGVQSHLDAKVVFTPAP